MIGLSSIASASAARLEPTDLIISAYNVVFSAYQLIEAVLKIILVAKPCTTKTPSFSKSCPICMYMLINPLTFFRLLDADHRRLASTFCYNGVCEVMKNFSLKKSGFAPVSRMTIDVIYASFSSFAITTSYLRACTNRCDANIIFAPCSSHANLVCMGPAHEAYNWFDLLWLLRSKSLLSCESPGLSGLWPPEIGMGNTTSFSNDTLSSSPPTRSGLRAYWLLQNWAFSVKRPVERCSNIESLFWIRLVVRCFVHFLSKIVGKMFWVLGLGDTAN